MAPRMPSIMPASKHFAQVPTAQIERSTFDRSHGLKTTFNAGDLVPVFVDEVYPGDTFNLKMSALLRMTTPFKPVMDNMFAETFFFFVPWRLVWSHWVNFMGEKVNPADSTVYTVPVFTAHQPAALSLSDYFGIPTVPGANITFTSLYHRAYNLIYNQWFRDENLIDSATVDVADGPDAIANYVIRKRGKRFDYFTSCLPWPQKGTAVALPLGTSAPVLGLATFNAADPTDGTPGAALQTGGVAPSGWAGYVSTTGNPVLLRMAQATAGGPPVLTADLTNATSATINDLRVAFQVQRMLERDARGGTRYTEMVQSHFRVTSPDARLQRAEYLGGGSSQILFTPVAQTTPTPATGTTTPQGNLAATVTGIASGHGFVKSFTEHGCVIGILNVRADLTYQQGLDRMFTRSSRVDFYFPAFAHLGEQAVYNKEIYCKGDANDALVFGYQERYAELRYKPSRLTGKMRHNASPTYEIWHLSEVFGSLPALNQTFIEDQLHTVLQRIEVVNTEPDFYMDAYFNYITARPLPTYGVPGLIDHF